jgi:hypothetical protein
VPWLLSVYAGRVNIEEGKACYNAKGKRADGPITGVQHSAGEFLSAMHSLSYPTPFICYFFERCSERWLHYDHNVPELWTAANPCDIPKGINVINTKWA